MNKVHNEHVFVRSTSEDCCNQLKASSNVFNDQTNSLYQKSQQQQNDAKQPLSDDQSPFAASHNGCCDSPGCWCRCEYCGHLRALLPCEIADDALFNSQTIAKLLTAARSMPFDAVFGVCTASPNKAHSECATTATTNNITTTKTCHPLKTPIIKKKAAFSHVFVTAPQSTAVQPHWLHDHLLSHAKTPASALFREDLQTCTKPEEAEKILRKIDFLKMIQRKHPYDSAGFAKYTVERLIGYGTFGFVLEARRCIAEPQSPTVAIKAISKASIAASQLVESGDGRMLPIEVSVLQRLSHPAILTVVDVFEDDRYYFMVTERFGFEWRRPTTAITSPQFSVSSFATNKDDVWVEFLNFVPSDPTLHRLYSFSEHIKRASRLSVAPVHPTDLFECIESHGTLPMDRVRHIFVQITHALDYLHGCGIAHGDLKDENILIDAKFAIRLADFGSCLPTTPSITTPPHRYLGTLQFAPPEVHAANEAIDAAACDVWAAGMLLFLLVTGENFPTGACVAPATALTAHRSIINGILFAQFKRIYFDRLGFV